MRLTTGPGVGPFRLKSILAVTLLVAAAFAGAAQASRAHVSLGAGRAAIDSFSAKVARVSSATSFEVSGCSSHASGVSCAVRLNYRNVGIYCNLRAGAFYEHGALKVKRVSPIKCDAFSLTS